MQRPNDQRLHTPVLLQPAGTLLPEPPDLHYRTSPPAPTKHTRALMDFRSAVPHGVAKQAVVRCSTSGSLLRLTHRISGVSAAVY